MCFLVTDSKYKQFKSLLPQLDDGIDSGARLWRFISKLRHLPAVSEFPHLNRAKNTLYPMGFVVKIKGMNT